MKQILLVFSLASILIVSCSSGTEKKAADSQQKGTEQYDDLLKNLENKTKPATKKAEDAGKDAATQKSE